MHDGISCYPTPPESIPDVVEVRNRENVRTIRLSFRTSYSPGQHPYRKSTVDYALQNTPSDTIIIVDGNHLTPPDSSTANSAISHWSSIEDRIKEILEDYPNNPRVAVELINEFHVSTNSFYDRMQQLVNMIRSLGYNNQIVYNKLTWVDGRNNWRKLNDPLNACWDGYHVYMQDENLNTIINSMRNAVNMGINVINTECGPSAQSPSQFTQERVNALNSFYQECASIGVRNCTWISWGDIDENWYWLLKNAGVVFSYETNGPMPPPTHNLTVRSTPSGIPFIMEAL